MLEFLAEHRAVAVSQVQALLGCAPRTAGRRVQALRAAGLLRRERIFEGLPAACWITRAGLRLVESDLPAPRMDLKGYRHDVGLAWLWVAARNGAFGRLDAVVSERSMRSADRRREGRASPASWPMGDRYGIGVAGSGSRGGLALHYPDLVLDTASGQRVAIELELTAKPSRRLDRIMLGYAAAARVDVLLYLCPNRAMGLQVQAAARRAGISDQVHVQLLAPGSPAGAPDPGRARERVGELQPARRAARSAGRASGGREAALER